MQRKAMILSLAIHFGVLAPGLIPLSPAPPPPPPTERILKVSMVAPPSRKTSERTSVISQGFAPAERPAPADIPAVPNSLVIEVDRSGFGNIFAAAANWHATLHSGVPYNDPGAFQVFFCRAADYSSLNGQYEPGDAVWFNFPLEFKERLLDRIRSLVFDTRFRGTPAAASIQFTTDAPDYFAVLSVREGIPTSGACK